MSKNHRRRTARLFGHVRQLDRVLGELLARAWKAGAGPGAQRLVIDVDSFIQEVHGKKKHGASYGYTSKLGYHPLVATRSGRRGAADALSDRESQQPARDHPL